MEIKNIIEAIIEKHKDEGIYVYAPATPNDISFFEQEIGFALPKDFIDFYTTCNGFECTEDIFIMTTLKEITDPAGHYGNNWFYFSEYMTYSDMWGLRLTKEGKYEIFNGSYSNIAMTTSLEEFLQRFLKGDVFETGGLYDWQEELKIQGG